MPGQGRYWFGGGSARKITLSVIKADIGSIGGHICPSRRLLEAVRSFIAEHGKRLLLDSYISHTGDDIAIVMTHNRGVRNADIYKLAWDTFVVGTQSVKNQGLYGAGQDLLKDAFSGNVRGVGPASAEMEFEECLAEPFLFFAADKTDPGAFNLPLYQAFADPMNTPGLMLAPSMAKGLRFTIMDVNPTAGNRIIELNALEELYDIAALLRDTERYVVESVWSRATHDQAVAPPPLRACTTSRASTPARTTRSCSCACSRISTPLARSSRPMLSAIWWRATCAARTRCRSCQCR